jgi:hypothetical protein
MRKTAVVAALIGSLCLFSCSKKSTTSNSSSTASPPIVSASPSPPPFTVCSGTYALCTTAPCQLVNGKLLCDCDVKQGYSAATNSCSSVPTEPPHTGQSIPSRYYPIKSMAVCSNSQSWASCLDAPCTVEADVSKAKCTCAEAPPPSGSYVVVTDSYSGTTCTSGIIWSSATLTAVNEITAFLKTSEHLKPFHITIVGPGGEKK